MSGDDFLQSLAAFILVATPVATFYVAYLQEQNRRLKSQVQRLEEANRDYQRIIGAMVEEYEDR